MSDMEVRRRGNKSRKSGSPDASGDHSGSTRKSENIDRTFTRLIVVLLVLVLSLAGTVIYFPHVIPPKVIQTVDNVLFNLRLAPREYAIVIDAGSTGSRVLGFSFHRNLITGQLKLDDELWVQVKPGLSSYAENPSEAGKGVTELLGHAKNRIPKSHWANTPITLKATAGLRLLPKQQSEDIISEVKNILVTSGFQPEEPLIEIMNPMEEGLFAWFTVNFLLDSLTEKVYESDATLDLGGGSTQITFAPKEAVLDLGGRKHYIHNVTVLRSNVEVYSHSYLGLGLMAAREAIFTSGSKSGELNLNSNCISSEEPQKFSFHGNNYVISKGSKAGYDNCLIEVRELIKKEDVHVPSELKNRNVAAFSYFFDKAIDAGIVPEGQTEGQAAVKDFIEAAKKACSDPSSKFNCVDLTFISTLLTEGYGLPLHKEIRLYKKINGHEVSWALGVAYSILEKDN